MLSHQGIWPDIAVEALHRGRDREDLTVHDPWEYLHALGNPRRAFQIVAEALEKGLTLHHPAPLSWGSPPPSGVGLLRLHRGGHAGEASTTGDSYSADSILASQTYAASRYADIFGT